MTDRAEQIEPTGGRAWLWQSAAGLAGRLHAGHHRRDKKTPYVTHPFRVTLTLRHVFGCGDEVVLAAALLHDIIEDTPGDREDVTDTLTEAGVREGVPRERAAALADEVAELVVAMTKDMRLAEPVREPAYDQQLAAADPRARLLKLADTYDNLADALAEGKSGRSSVGKCRRALALARAGLGGPGQAGAGGAGGAAAETETAGLGPVFARAIAAVEALIRRAPAAREAP